MRDFENIFNKMLNDSSDKFSRTKKRVLVKKTGKIPQNAFSGRVIASIGRIFLVSSLESEQLFECVVGGKLISDNGESTLVSTGDRVTLMQDQENRSDLKTGIILKVDERKSWLARKEVIGPWEQVIASNINQLLIIVSTREPEYNTRLIDRLIVTAEYGNLKPVICVNKIDLSNTKKIQSDFEVYKNIGIKIHYVSAKNNSGLEELKDTLSNKETVLCGPSGVGKSTMINSIFQKDIQSVGNVSVKTSKGRHTTSFVRMFELPFSGRIIDTPGIREFQLGNLDKEELALYFHDFDDFRENCKFMPCTHTHEPKCAIKDAVVSDQISIERYESYLNMYESLASEK